MYYNIILFLAKFSDKGRNRGERVGVREAKDAIKDNRHIERAENLLDIDPSQAAILLFSYLELHLKYFHYYRQDYMKDGKRKKWSNKFPDSRLSYIKNMTHKNNLLGKDKKTLEQIRHRAAHGGAIFTKEEIKGYKKYVTEAIDSLKDYLYENKKKFRPKDFKKLKEIFQQDP